MNVPIEAPDGSPGTPVRWAILDLHGSRAGIRTRSPPASAGGFLAKVGRHLPPSPLHELLHPDG